MSTDIHFPLPYVARPGDVLVELPHTLTAATRGPFDARARSVLPSATSFARHATDPRLVLDARGCAVMDETGLATLWALRRAAAAAGVEIVVVDAPPALAAWLASGRQPPMPLAFRSEDPEPAAVPAAPNAPPEPGVLPLDDAARARLARRRRR
ncbi:Sulfate transporter/antisigma-factor antagonist STAS [Gemmatirosa kalamazoonensis]|jgi:anti-anti-sigma regulatory factor|uniref:Sulfate transporter/antisigma-factor antagonist STAS n=1 Tax=Gemmatirosa kalamazoonensis TaxID=861299 RepID=W0RDQ3_9BACT|nr:STAS domain-containing protein [Gemmatirosa kalamazoonensis]AHG88936.1 Sulfate transporter/antisigma-factor antagonist STAS [Gemmatirosa kalamazoonensis]